jgi:hypothetical protein
MSPIPLGILAAAGGAPAEAYELISTQVLSSTTSSVTFSSIPQDFKHLQIRFTALASTSNGTRSLRIRYNNDSGANYNSHYIFNSGSLVNSSYSSSSALVGYQVWPDPSAAGNSIVDILDYSSSSKNKTHRYFYGVYGTQIRVEFGSGLWRNTDAITSFTIEQFTGYSMQAGSRFSLYGIKG